MLWGGPRLGQGGARPGAFHEFGTLAGGRVLMYRRRHGNPSQQVVVLDYTLKDDAGSVIDKSGKTPCTTCMATRISYAGLEEALEGHGPGDNVEVSIPPEKGYGTCDPKLVSKLADLALARGLDAHEGPEVTTSRWATRRAP